MTSKVFEGATLMCAGAIRVIVCLGSLFYCFSFVAMIVKNVNGTLRGEMLQVFIFFGIFIDSGNKTKTKFLGRSIVRQWWSLKTCKIKFKKCLQ